MVSKRFTSLETFLTAITEEVQQSSKEECRKYVKETVEKCYDLCCKGEEVLALNEIKFMLLNLKKEFSI